MGRQFALTVDGVTRNLDIDSMLISEARDLKRLTGLTFLDWQNDLFQLDATSIAFAWWLACRRDGAPIPGAFSDLDFDMGAMNIEYLRPEGEPDDDAPEADAEGPTGLEPDTTPDQT